MIKPLISIKDIRSEEEEGFCMDIALGAGYAEAFKHWFPERAVKVKSLGASGYQLAQRPKMANRIMELVKAREDQNTKALEWTRTKSIEKLHYVINCCQAEINRVNKAFEDELQFLEEQINETSDPAEIRKLVNKMIKLRQKSHLNKIQISGITDAIAELNTMHGFNESNVNINSAVSFVGEEDLED